MDLAIELPPVTAMDLAAPATGETSAQIAHRIAEARAAQISRAKELQTAEGPVLHPSVNARLSDMALEKAAKPDHEGEALLLRAAESLSLSARGYTRILRVARTLADLDGSDGVMRRHIAEAISYRRRDNLAASEIARQAGQPARYSAD